MPDPKILPFPDRKGQVRQEKRNKIEGVFNDMIGVMGEDPGFKELGNQRRKEATEAELKAGPAAFRTGDLVAHADQEAYPWKGRVMQFEIEPDEPVHRLGPSYRENDFDGPGHYYNVNWYNPKLGQYHQDYVHQDNLRPYGVKKMDNSDKNLSKFWADKREAEVKAEALFKLTKALKFVEAQALKKMDGTTNPASPMAMTEEEKKKKKDMEKKAEEVEKCGEMTKPVEKGCEEMVKKSELVDRNDERRLLVKYGKEKTDRILTAAAAQLNGGEEMKKSEKLFEALSKSEEFEVKNIVYWRNRKADAPTFVKE